MNDSVPKITDGSEDTIPSQPIEIAPSFIAHFAKFKRNESSATHSSGTPLTTSQQYAVPPVAVSHAYFLNQEPLTKHNRQRFVSNSNATPTIHDSGTTTNITNIDTANLHNLPIFQLKPNKSLVIRFGQGTVAIATSYCNMGPIIGRAYIIANAPYTLISTTLMTEKGLTVAFDKKRVTITDDFTGKILYRKNKDKSTGLYEMDLASFLRINTPSNFGIYKEATRTARRTFPEAERAWAEDSDAELLESEDGDDHPTTVWTSQLALPTSPTIDDDVCHTCLHVFTEPLFLQGIMINEDEDPALAPTIPFKPLREEDSSVADPLSLLVTNNVSSTLLPAHVDVDIDITERMPNKRMRGTRISNDLSLRIHLLHKRMLHPGAENMAKAIESGQWKLDEKDEDITPNLIRRLFDRYPCTACKLAKTNKLTQQSGSGLLPDSPGHTISFDYKGPIKPRSLSGYTGMFVDVDSTTLYMRQTPTKSKDASCVIEHLKETIAFYRSHGWVVRYVKADSGSEILSKEVHDFLRDQPAPHPAIYVQPSPPYTQQADPVERSIQTMIKGLGALLVDQYMLPDTHWDSAARAWTLGHNATPNSHTPQSTPYFEVTHTKPKLDVFFRLPYGCPVIVNKEVGRTDGSFEVVNHFGVAIGDDPNGSGSFEVIIPGKYGREFYNRKNVTALPLAYKPLTSIQRLALKPTISERTPQGLQEIQFFSSISSDPADPLERPIQGSTLGNNMFGIEDYLPSSSQIQSPSLSPQQGEHQPTSPISPILLSTPAPHHAENISSSSSSPLLPDKTVIPPIDRILSRIADPIFSPYSARVGDINISGRNLRTNVKRPSNFFFWKSHNSILIWRANVL